MAIRVTQHTMYNTMVGHMQSNLGAYMESVEQGASQKKINRPSDDPAGTYRVLTTRVDMTNTTQYQENVDTAKGWLNLADDVLSKQVTTAITGLKTLAEQSSTGTYTAEQRRIMADQAKQYFGQLLNLANTEFEGKSIFAGHKYDKNAFEQGLAITPPNKEWQDLIDSGDVTITGASGSTVLIEFTADGPLNEAMTYRWSNDGGQTWIPKDGEGEKVTDDGNGHFILQPTDAGITISVNNSVNLPKKIEAADSNKNHGPSNGTFLYVRPAAFYQGDDKDPPAQVTSMGSTALAKTEAIGTFGTNVLVRVDGVETGVNGKYGPVDLNKAGTAFDWSYSTDGGSTWVTAKSTVPAGNTLRFPIPGGYAEVDITGVESIPAKDQFLVHPSRADLDYEIMKDTYLSVNSVGKDVFGGYYEGKPALDGENNLFEVVGAFIGYLEGNNQEGCQKTLAALTKAEQQVLAEATRIGGMENRLEMAADVLSFQKIDQQERLSYVEDIDLTELLTKLTRQQLSYQTVLQSSSMIMQLSLANYI